MLPDELYTKTCHAVSAILKTAPGCHDFDHTMRTAANAELIAAKELPIDSPDLLIIRLAAILHDVARPEEMASGGKLCHAQLGRVKSEKILREIGCSDDDLIHAVSECVGRHRYRGADHPQTLPEKIVYDADKLDSIGAVGVGRAFHFAGRIGARLHNTAEEALSGAAYGREDSAYREYLVKLRDVPERMLTATGHELALTRAAFMHEFFKQINQETDTRTIQNLIEKFAK